LLTLHWLLTVAAVLIAVVALAKARRATKRLERLTETYWELRYDHGQLRARVARIDGETAAQAQPEAAAKPAANFVPLSSLRR
jgi:3-phenylpropionate/cinnamic acid dioxygenase small subunit